MGEMNGKTFYVKPFEDRVKHDLENLTKISRKYGVIVEQRNDGSYSIYTKTTQNTLWGILYRRFLAESKHVCVDPDTHEKFFPVIFSTSLIVKCARRPKVNE